MSHAEEVILSLEQTVDNMKDIIDFMNRQAKKESHVDKELVDIEHIFQKGNLDGRGLSKVGSFMSKKRNERANFQRERETLGYFMTFVKDNKEFMNKMSQVLINMKAKQKQWDEKVYGLRVLDREQVELLTGKKLEEMGIVE